MALLAGPGLAAAPARAQHPATTAPAPRNVLLLYEDTRLLPAIVAADHAIRETLTEGEEGAPLQIHTEYLELSLYAGPDQLEALQRHLATKYAGRRFDLVIPWGTGALRFALQRYTQLFPGAPVVFSAVQRTALDDLPLPPGVTGVTHPITWRETVDLALRLHPEAREVVVVAGAGAVDRRWLAQARTALAALPPRVRVTYVTDGSMAQLLAAVKGLAPGAVVVYGVVTRDAAGHAYLPDEVLAAIADAAPVPVYGLSEPLLGNGMVGGHLVPFATAGRLSAGLGLRVLRGERLGMADAIHLGGIAMFDGRQLRRWGIPESRLPAGSVIRFQVPSAWSLYGPYIAGGVSLIVLQALLIAGLLVQRAQRRRAQRTLDERLRFERVLSRLSAMFVTLPAAEIGQQIDRGLALIAEQLGLDRARLVEFGADGRIAVVHSSSPAEENPAGADQLPWTAGRLRAGEVVRFATMAELPPAAAWDGDVFRRDGVRSFAALPLSVGGELVGALFLAALRAERDWPAELVRRLELMAEVLANALGRQRAEGAVRESEARFRAMAEAAPIMVWMAGLDGRRTYLNRSWLEFVGWPAEEVLGDRWTEHVHPDDAAAVVVAAPGAMASGQPFTLEYRLRRWDGEYRWLLDHGTPRGNGEGYIGTSVDITDVKAAQEARMESIALRSAIFTSLYGEVAALDQDGTIIAVNEAWTRFARDNGGDPARVSVDVNYPQVCRNAMAAGDLEAKPALEALLAVLEGQAERLTLEYPLRVGGEERWYEMTVEALRRPERGAIVSHVDVTRRRRAEEEARAQRIELAHALRVTTMGELAASLAHEINQPLAAIVGNAQAARRLLDGPQPSTDELRETLVDIADDGKRAAQIIRRLRALFRKEGGERQPVSLNDLVAEVTSLLRHELDRQQVATSLALAPGLPPVPGDAIQLQQVVLNILVNAAEAMAGQAPPRQLTISTVQPEPGLLRLAVADTGPGVPESDLERIFEAFVSTKSEGLGMGLSIGRSIVRAHGGRMWATRNAERGLTIHVELPCEEGGLRP
jgi:PAS domain S-box-containing protein